MIEHIVMFKIKRNTPADKINSMTESLNGLKNKIPELIDMHAGVNFSHRNKGFDVMLVSRFRNKEDLKIYVDHPEHRKVIEEMIQPIREDVIVGDLEH
ncbi:Dabb family protein [bacterium]|nr:Dabb family protein [bacterium]